jgi:hypothetical protein
MAKRKIKDMNLLCIYLGNYLFLVSRRKLLIQDYLLHYLIPTSVAAAFYVKNNLNFHALQPQPKQHK